jgi:hypothetical protein
MARLNLTLDQDTFSQLNRAARTRHRPVATHARELLREALERERQEERWRVWEDAYRADRADARRALAAFEPGQLALMDDEDA